MKNKGSEYRIIQVGDKIQIGSNIKKIRKAHGYKQIEFLTQLQLLGIDISIYSLNRIEQGTQNPTVSFLFAACCILKCDMNTLFQYE